MSDQETPCGKCGNSTYREPLCEECNDEEIAEDLAEMDRLASIEQKAREFCEAERASCDKQAQGSIDVASSVNANVLFLELCKLLGLKNG